jgi:S-adenosylmethionine hydrolase
MKFLLVLYRWLRDTSWFWVLLFTVIPGIVLIYAHNEAAKKVFEDLLFILTAINPAHSAITYIENNLVGILVIAITILIFAAVRQYAYSMPYRPIIAVQTDYGTQSPYMGALLGAIYKIDKYARIKMITAEIKSYDHLHAAWTLRLASEEFPPGTIFLCVTNPGGTTTRPAVIETANGHIYVGHDNGLFDLVVRDYGYKRGFVISSPRLNKEQYQSLYGISLFAPTAAWLSNGFRISRVGAPISTYDFRLPPSVKNILGNAIECTVKDIDRFGNCTLNVTEADLSKINLTINMDIFVSHGNRREIFPFKETYGYVSAGDYVAINFLGYVQLAIRQGNLSESWSIMSGDILKLAKC